MKKLVSTIAVVGLVGFGLATTAPAFAGPTSDQAAAESDMVTAAPATPHGDAAVVLPGDTAGNPANAVNGGAQSRIYEQQLHQNGQ
jgi:hypothetical protein